MRSTAILVLVLVACGGGRDVDRLLGARCDDDNDCDERCLGPNNDFPEGLCSYRCEVSDECPPDAWCIDTNGGVCLFDCIDDLDCDFLGREWVCRDRDLRNGGGRERVCVGR
ncbi:MAG: hypothetical protein ACKV2T_08730 [Kofleriaceae bacterium]